MPTLARHKTPVFKRRDPYRHIYQSAQWHTFSKNYLSRPENRLCRACLAKGVIEVAKNVDHVVPMVQWIPQGGNVYDLNNLQALCKPCHSRKTKEEQKCTASPTRHRE